MNSVLRTILILAALCTLLVVANAQTSIVTQYDVFGPNSVTHTLLHPFPTEDDLVTTFNGTEYSLPPENYEIILPKFDPTDDMQGGVPNILTAVQLNYSKSRHTFWEFEHTSPNPVTANNGAFAEVWVCQNDVDYPNGWPYSFVSQGGPETQQDSQYDFPAGEDSPAIRGLEFFDTIAQTGFQTLAAFDGTLDFDGPSSIQWLAYPDWTWTATATQTNSISETRPFYRGDENDMTHLWLCVRGHWWVTQQGQSEPQFHWSIVAFGQIKITAMSFTYWYEPDESAQPDEDCWNQDIEIEQAWRKALRKQQ